MHKVAEVSLTHSRGGVSSSVDDVTDTQRCLIISSTEVTDTHAE